MIQVKRVYDPQDNDDGKRFLVERLWPRGMKKENLQMDGWLKDAAPSDGLRRWFGHDPAKWEEFCRRYIAELGNSGEIWEQLLHAALQGTVTLLYSSRDQQHNNAVALKTFLDGQLKKRTRSSEEGKAGGPDTGTKAVLPGRSKAESGLAKGKIPGRRLIWK